MPSNTWQSLALGHSASTGTAPFLIIVTIFGATTAATGLADFMATLGEGVVFAELFCEACRDGRFGALGAGVLDLAADFGGL